MYYPGHPLEHFIYDLFRFRDTLNAAQLAQALADSARASRPEVLQAYRVIADHTLGHLWCVRQLKRCSAPHTNKGNPIHFTHIEGHEDPPKTGEANGEAKIPAKICFT